MKEKRPQEDIIQWIRTHHESLSPSQRKVAEFLIAGGIDVIHLTITQIANAVDVNSSTVVRTAQSLGFEGFPELQSVLRSQFLNQAKIAQRMQVGSKKLIEDLSDGTNEDEHLLNTMLRDEIKTLMELPEQVPMSTIETVVDMLDEASHVYIIGLGATFPPALNFGNFLRYIRPDTTVLKPGIDPLPAQLTPLKKGDLIFSLCFARYTRETLTVMEVGKQREASVITVTDSHFSPAAKRADISMVIPYRLRLYGNSVALFALLDAILGTLSLRYPERTRQRLDILEELYDQFNLLTKSDD